MKQVISKNGKVLCVTTVPYSAKVVKEMKQAGYKVTNKED
jgi:predicted fused transcriptional regulator/phosphomethylpyrimidine kinase